MAGYGPIKSDNSHPTSRAYDNNYNTYAMTGPFGTGLTLPANSGWMEFTFNQPVNFGAIDFYQQTTALYTYYPEASIPINNGMSSPGVLVGVTQFDGVGPASFVNFTDTSISLANTGALQFFDNNGGILYTTGVRFDGPLILSNDKVITGVKRLKIFRNDSEPRYLAFSQMVIYD